MTRKSELPSLVEEAVLAAEKRPGADDLLSLAREGLRLEPSDRKLYERRFAELKAIRAPMEPIWRDIRDYLLPECGMFLDGDSPEAGDETYRVDYSAILDSSPTRAVGTAASGLHGGLTSPSVQWFSYYVSSYQGRDEFDEKASEAVKDWVYNAQLAVRDVLFSGNFYSAIQEFYKEVLGFATAAMMITQDFETVARFYPLTVGTYWLGMGDDLRFNTLYRKFSVTATSIVETYGKENCPERVVEAIRNNKPDTRFYVIQCIQPWNMFGNHKAHPEFKYEDVRFVEGSSDTDPILYLGGYVTRPFVAARWTDTADHVYGRSCPGMATLPDNMQLQTMTQQANMAMEWLSDPAWLVPDTMVEGKKITPGSMVKYSGDPRSAQIHPLIPGGFDFSMNQQKVQYLVSLIQDGFYNRLFAMIQNRQSNMTATEVMQLVEEKSALLGPVVMHLMANGLTPSLDRVFELITLQGMLPPPPEEIAGQHIRPYFTSSLAIAQRQAAMAGRDRSLLWLGQAAQMDPQVLDGADLDEWWREKAESDDLPANVIRGEDEVAEIRAQRQQAQQQAAQAQAMAAGAQTAKTLGDAEVSPDNALGQLMAGTVGGGE